MNRNTIRVFGVKTIVTILTYGCELWCFEKQELLERLHLKFCKYVLGLKKSNPDDMV